MLVTPSHFEDLHSPLDRNGLLGGKSIPAETFVPLVLFFAGDWLLVFHVFQFRGLVDFERVIFSE